MADIDWDAVVNNLVSGSTTLLLNLLGVNGLARGKAFEFFKATSDFMLNLLQDITPLAELEIQLLIDTYTQGINHCGSEYKFFNYLQRQNLYVAPLEQTITQVAEVDEDLLVRTVDCRKVVVPIYDTYYCLFNRTDLLQKILFRREEILREEAEDPDIIQSFVQGDLWNQMLQTIGVNTDLVDCGDVEGRTFYVPIFHNFDDFHTTTLFCSHSERYKIGGKYTNIPLVPKNLQSKVENIRLSGLHYSRHHNALNNESIFQNVIDGLNRLFYEGIILHDEIRRQFNIKKVVLVPALQTGDLLGLFKSNSFITAFSTGNHLCHICRMPSNVRDEFHEENEAFLRTREDYQRDVIAARALQDRGGNNPNNSTGIIGESVFNRIVPEIYHCITHMAFDTLHTFDIGILPRALSTVVIDLGIDEVELNDRLNAYPWTIRVTNRPAGKVSRAYLAQNHKFLMTASESLAFLYHFLFIIGDRVPAQSDHWRMIVCLQTLGKKLHQKRFNRETDPPLLRELVSDYFRLAIALGIPRTPKAHILTHAPRDLIWKGPFHESNCSRPEAKHSDIKQADMHNRLNLPLTLAIKQQLKFASILHNGFTNDDGFQYYGTRVDLREFLLLCDCPYVTGQINQIVPGNLRQFRTHSEYRYNGESIRTKDVIVHAHRDDLNYLPFYEVEHILSFTRIDNTVSNHLLCKPLFNERFDDHYNAYRVRYATLNDCQYLGINKYLILPLTNENIMQYRVKSAVVSTAATIQQGYFVDWQNEQ